MCFKCPHCGAQINDLAAEEQSSSNASWGQNKVKEDEHRRAPERKEASDEAVAERKPKADSKPWFDRAPGPPNNQEVLFFTLLVLTHDRTVTSLNDWAKEVLVELSRSEALGDAWTPPPSWKVGNGSTPTVFEPIDAAYARRQWTIELMEQIGCAMQAWRGEGWANDVQPGRLKSHWPAKVKGPSMIKKKPNGGPARWLTINALFGVARLVCKHATELRQLLHLDMPLKEVPTIEMELEEARAENKTLLEQMKPLVLIKDAHRKMKSYNKDKDRSVTIARKEERKKVGEKAKEKAMEAQKQFRQKLVMEMRASKAKEVEKEKARLNEQYADRFEEQRVRLNTARARARAVEKETGKAERKLRRIEKSAAKQAEAEDASDEMELEPRELPFELKPRRDESGRFQAEADELHALRLVQEARGVAPSKVSANIQDVLSLFAPDVEIPSPCERQSRLLRGEVTICGEAMAAFKFALATRILFFGWDESTKFGDSVFGCSCSVEYADGTREDVCLRGLTMLPDGGTSKAILSHIETRIFAHSRRLLTQWMELYEKKNGTGSWAAAGGPSPENIGLHRLCENTVLMTDTCNGARCTKRMLAEAIMRCMKENVGQEKWDAMSTEERKEKYRVIRADCWQHLRNIMIDAMAATGDALLKEVLADSLELFSSFERIEVEGSNVIHAVFKHLHHIGEYAKGRGREFTVDVKKGNAAELFIPFERALGNRQDLKFDGCVPLLWNRLFILQYIRGYMDCSKSQSILDKSIYTILKCNEFVALLRANTLWKFAFSEPFRWLSGKTGKLEEWSLVKMSGVLDQIESAMEKVVQDPSLVLDPSFDMFQQTAAELPEFKEWRDELLATTVKALDGKTEHRVVEKVLQRVRSPEPGSGEHQATDLTLRIIKAQAKRALEKLHDERLALADKLESQDGRNSLSKNADLHERLKGIAGTNDSSENKFASADYIMRFFRGISTLNASGIVQQRSAHDFDRPVHIVSDRRKRKRKAVEPPKLGFFWRLSPELRSSLLELARCELYPSISKASKERRQHNEEKLARREEALTRQLNAVVEKYAAAMELYDQWRSQGVTNASSLTKALAGLSPNEQIAELRRQIEMRTLGLGWYEFETKWGFYADEKQHTIDALRDMLIKDILPHERALGRLKKLPAAAALPPLKVRSLKVLGTDDADALRIEATSLFNADRLLEKAKAARARREAAGISDSVEAVQQREAPAFDIRLVGKWLEICWPYKGPDGKTLKIWASGLIKRVADGLTDKAPKGKKILPAGALLWAWEADVDREEPAGEKWLILLPNKWNKHVQYAWRFDPCELAVQGQPKPPPRAPRVEEGASDDEYLTSDEAYLSE